MKQIEPVCGAAAAGEIKAGRFDSCGKTLVGESHDRLSAVFRRIKQTERHVCDSRLFPTEFGAVVIRSLIGPSALAVVGDRIGITHVDVFGEIKYGIARFQFQIAVLNGSGCALKTEEERC